MLTSTSEMMRPMKMPRKTVSAQTNFTQLMAMHTRSEELVLLKQGKLFPLGVVVTTADVRSLQMPLMLDMNWLREFGLVRRLVRRRQEKNGEAIVGSRGSDSILDESICYGVSIGFQEHNSRQFHTVASEGIFLVFRRQRRKIENVDVELLLPRRTLGLDEVRKARVLNCVHVFDLADYLRHHELALDASVCGSAAQRR